MQAVDVPGTTHEPFAAAMKKAKAWCRIMALLAEAQVFGWTGTWERGGEVLFKDVCLEAGCQGRPGPKSSEGRHFAVPLIATVAEDPGRWDISPDGDHVLLAGFVEAIESTQPRHQLLSVEVVTQSGGKT